MAASKVDAHMKRMDVEYISVREIHRLHIPLGLEGCHAFTTKHFSEQEPDRAKRIPKVSLFPLAFQRDTVTNTDVSSTREGGMDFYVPTSRLGFVFSEIARSRDVIGIIMFSPTSI